MEFKLNKTQRLVTHAAANYKDRREVFRNVHITAGKIEASNVVILVQRNIDYDGEELLLNAEDIAKHKDAKGLEGVVYTNFKDSDNIQALGQDITIIPKTIGNFPETKHLWPTEDPVFKISLSRQHLLSLLQCFDSKEENQLLFYFYGAERPAKVETINQDAKGLIMPMEYEWNKEKV